MNVATPTKTAMKTPSKIRSLLICAICVAFGAAAMLVVLYKRPGSALVNKVLVMSGIREDMGSRFPYGWNKMRDPSEWTGVQSPTHPEWKVRKGVDVVRVATGFTYPVNVVHKENAGGAPGDPYVYVNELHGAVKYVTRDGTVGTFADGLINFDPIPLAKSDEAGLSGLATIPGSNDLIVTGAYMDEASGLLQNRVLRLVSSPDGKTSVRTDTLLDLKEFTSPSNQIQQALIGPDGKLWVSVGDAENPHLSIEKTKFAGKLLRLNLDGSAPSDNPFYDSNQPDSPISYVYAYGLRNCFDIAFHPKSKEVWVVDNGKHTDRLAQVERAGDYGWTGEVGSTAVNASFVWTPTVSPCGMAFVEDAAKLGFGSPDSLFVALYGPPGAVGANHAKRIVEFRFDPATGLVKGVPKPFVQYVGDEKTTVLGLAVGDDGLYFTDFFGASIEIDATGAGSLWRVVPSEATAKLKAMEDVVLQQLSPLDRGQVYFTRNCAPCHRLQGEGGAEGPELTHFAREATGRLNSPGYAALLKKLSESTSEFVVAEAPRRAEVEQATGEARVKIWLKHHLIEPRFDNPRGKMPSFSTLSEGVREEIMLYVLSATK